MSRPKPVSSFLIRKLFVASVFRYLSSVFFFFSAFAFPLVLSLFLLVLWIISTLLFFYRLYSFLVFVAGSVPAAGEPEAAAPAPVPGAQVDVADLVKLLSSLSDGQK